ncbi:hypothetical protein PPERSA_07400 [Pseudocohnilembus persalinus]|uniref:Uncharacterized protein n=1 Tax=Pseudocohnilembus persalinus TaxID=266149 RepID=A0A0V0QAC6_PSEPJ|nr:hypothetical protein PPERSA_07400 [Pseudocohnilembus persalinus]|eukprot:KRW99157.1 hypothetical protein PPERSA_07400 [Pseudocohnilembus persalinus]
MFFIIYKYQPIQISLVLTQWIELLLNLIINQELIPLYLYIIHIIPYLKCEKNNLTFMDWINDLWILNHYIKFIDYKLFFYIKTIPKQLNFDPKIDLNNALIIQNKALSLQLLFMAF